MIVLGGQGRFGFVKADLFKQPAQHVATAPDGGYERLPLFGPGVVPDNTHGVGAQDTPAPPFKTLLWEFPFKIPKSRHRRPAMHWYVTREPAVYKPNHQPSPPHMPRAAPDSNRDVPRRLPTQARERSTYLCRPLTSLSRGNRRMSAGRHDIQPYRGNRWCLIAECAGLVAQVRMIGKWWEVPKPSHTESRRTSLDPRRPVLSDTTSPTHTWWRWRRLPCGCPRPASSGCC